MPDNNSEDIEFTDAIKKELDSRLERFYKGRGKFYTLEQAKGMWAKKRDKK